jgi:hypothetical protein
VYGAGVSGWGAGFRVERSSAGVSGWGAGFRVERSRVWT